jgi:hypothetical protein
MPKTEQEIEALSATIEAARKLYHEQGDALPGAKLRELQAHINDAQRARALAIADGCSPCPSCSEQPVGMVQTVQLSGQSRQSYEIGCEHCLAHRALGLDVEGARRAWERGPGHPQGWRPPKGGRELKRTVEGIVTTMPSGREINWSAEMTLKRRALLAREAINESATLDVGRQPEAEAPAVE